MFIGAQSFQNTSTTAGKLGNLIESSDFKDFDFKPPEIKKIRRNPSLMPMKAKNFVPKYRGSGGTKGFAMSYECRHIMPTTRPIPASSSPAQSVRNLPGLYPPVARTPPTPFYHLIENKALNRFSFSHPKKTKKL